jgi:hypothetical protein
MLYQLIGPLAGHVMKQHKQCINEPKKEESSMPATNSFRESAINTNERTYRPTIMAKNTTKTHDAF